MLEIFLFELFKTFALGKFWVKVAHPINWNHHVSNIGVELILKHLFSYSFFRFDLSWVEPDAQTNDIKILVKPRQSLLENLVKRLRLIGFLLFSDKHYETNVEKQKESTVNLDYVRYISWVKNCWMLPVSFGDKSKINNWESKETPIDDASLSLSDNIEHHNDCESKDISAHGIFDALNKEHLVCVLVPNVLVAFLWEQVGFLHVLKYHLVDEI